MTNANARPAASRPAHALKRGHNLCGGHHHFAALAHRLLLSVAIAISYLDRQALSVPIAAIQQRHPAHQHGVLAAAVGVPRRLRADVRRRRRADRWARHAPRLLVIMIAWSLACAGHGLATGFAIARGQPVPARHRRGRRLSRGDQGRRRMVSRARAIDRDGHHQRRHRRRRRRRAAAHRRDPRLAPAGAGCSSPAARSGCCGPSGGCASTTRRPSTRGCRAAERDDHRRSRRRRRRPAAADPVVAAAARSDRSGDWSSRSS